MSKCQRNILHFTRTFLPFTASPLSTFVQEDLLYILGPGFRISDATSVGVGKARGGIEVNTHKLKMQFIFRIITHQHRWYGIRHFVAVILWHMPCNSFVTHIGCTYANTWHRHRPPCSSHHRKCSRSDCSATIDSGDNLSNSIRWVHHMSRKCCGTNDNGCYRSIQLKIENTAYAHGRAYKPKRTT